MYSIRIFLRQACFVPPGLPDCALALDNVAARD